MTEQLRQQLKTLINTFVEQKTDLDVCVDKIIELCQDNGEIRSMTSGQRSRRPSSIFDGVPISPSASASQRPQWSTYNEQGLVNNPNTVLYSNRDID